MKPLRIAMIGQQGLPARYGGVERAVEEVAARLAERGHHVTAFNKRVPDEPHIHRHRGIEIRYVRAINGKYTGNLTTSFLSTLHTLVHRYDIVHFHALGPTIFSPLARLRPGVKVVATVQGRDDQRAKWGGLAQRMLRAAAWTTAHVPHEVVVVSRALEADFSRQYGRNTVYIPNGVNPPPDAQLPDHPPILRRLDIEDNPFLMTLGRLVPEKAVDELIRAFAKVPGEARLVVVGGGGGAEEFEAELERLAAQDPRVVLAGPVFDDDLDALLRTTAGFVMPSHLEGLPLALLEAASYGAPLICSDIDPHVEVLEYSGPGRRLFRTGDVADLQHVLESFLDALPAEKAAAADVRESVLSRYSWDDIAVRLEETYEQLLAD
jgi:glycosyltransferase involved in cell wall biosynthesis